MRPTRLNLSALRENRFPRLLRTRLTPAKLIDSPDGITLTRREFLEMAGVATVGLSPTLKALETMALGSFELAEGEGLVAFTLGGQERWVIDSHRFSGCPKLKVERYDDIIHLELTGAKYPGTEIPADFACELRRSVIGWRMKLNLTLGNFMCEVPFERWLIGAEVARSNVNLNTFVCSLNASSHIVLSGTAEAEFFPNWLLRLNGSNVAILSGLGSEIVSDSIVVSLLDSDEPSLMELSEPKRTLLVMERGQRIWRMEFGLDTVDGGKIFYADDPFDVLRLEASENDVGLCRRAILVESHAKEAKLFFQPDGPLTDNEGKPFTLPLRNARCAVAFDPSGDQTALIAQFDKEPVWLCVDGYNLELGDGPNTPLFEIVTSNGKVETICCEPALLRVIAPLPDAIVEPTPVPDGTRIAFVTSGQPPIPPKRPDGIPIPPKKPDGAPTPPQKPDVGVVDVTKKTEVTMQLPTQPIIRVWRPDDLLVLGFEFINLQVQGGQLIRTDARKPAYIVVHLPPQSIAEEAFPEGEKSSVRSPRLPVKSRLAGSSRLVFIVPDNIRSIPYTLEALLRACAQYELSVTTTAQPTPPPPTPQRFRRPPALPGVVPGIRTQPAPPVQPPRSTSEQPGTLQPTPGAIAPIGKTIGVNPPEAYHTALEVPYRLIVSPSRMAAWVHSITAVTRNGRTELWHTRLAVRSQDGRIFDGRYIYGWVQDRLKVLSVLTDEDPNSFGIYYRTLRAIWTPGYKSRPAPLPAPAPSPFESSLDDNSRHQIVRLTGDPMTKDWTERVIRVNRLMLTSLGAWMDVRYMMEPPSDIALVEWCHRMTMGRDHHVRVVEKGFLFPFGHRAAKVEVTERRFHSEQHGNPAYLRKRTFIVVQEPEKFYETGDLRVDGKLVDLQNPFKRIRITTLVTPNLDPIVTVPGLQQESAFWPRVGNRDFLFHIVAEDLEGQRCEFMAPLIWVGNDIKDEAKLMEMVAKHYAESKDEKGALRAQRDLNGQRVAFAESNKPGDTSFEVETITFGAVVPAQNVKLPPNHEPRFYPVVVQASVQIPAVKQLLGKDVPATVKFHETYLKSGFGGKENKGEVFLDVLNKPELDFAGSGDKTGGLVTPNFSITGLSRLLGPTGGTPEKIASGQFDPEDFFKDVLEKAKLFGGIALKTILRAVEIVGTLTGLRNAPQMVTHEVWLNPKTKKPVEPESEGAERVTEVTFVWETEAIQDCDWGFIKFNLFNGATSKEGEPGGKQDTTKLFVKTVLTGKRVAPGQPMETAYSVEGVLNNFKVEFLWCISLEFDTFKLRIEKEKSPSPDPKIRKVEFIGPLSFVNKLSKVIPSGKFGGNTKEEPGGGGPTSPVTFDWYVKPMMSPFGVKVGFELGVNVPPMGVFSLRNVVLSSECRVPFTGDPVTLKFDFCKPEKPFLLTVWIFGGGGSFGVEIPLKDPVEVILNGSFEFGAMYVLDIGVASGEAHLAAGIFYHYEGGSKLTGYVRCGGALDILSIIIISVEFRMELNYDDTTTPTRVWGRATVTVTIEILFFSKSIDLTVEEEFAGSSRHLPFTEMVTEEQWVEYCEAFA